MIAGWVYILSNDAMPGLVKIGKTTRNVTDRALELYQTGVPLPFKIYAEVKTPDCHSLELWLHSTLKDIRVSNSREFFWCEPSFAENILNEGHEEQMRDWLSEFLPCHTLVEETYFVSPSTINMTADKCGLHHYDMEEIFLQLTSGDLAPAVRRHLDAKEIRKSRRDGGPNAWPIRSEDDVGPIH